MMPPLLNVPAPSIAELPTKVQLVMPIPAPTSSFAIAPPSPVVVELLLNVLVAILPEFVTLELLIAAPSSPDVFDEKVLVSTPTAPGSTTSIAPPAPLLL